MKALFFQGRRPLIIRTALSARCPTAAPSPPLLGPFVQSSHRSLPHLHRLWHWRRHTINCVSTRSTALRFCEETIVCEETTVCFLSCRFPASLLPLHSFRFARLVQDLLLRAVSFHFVSSLIPAGCCSPGSSPSTLQVLTPGNLSAGASDRTSGSTYIPTNHSDRVSGTVSLVFILCL
jgi:hypothetical protein